MSVSRQPAWHASVAGGVGSVCCVYSGLPFDTVKVRLQATTSYNSLWQCAWMTFRQEGPTAFFKGATAAITSAGVENVVVFTANNLIRKLWTSGDPSRTLSLPELACIGGLSGVASATAICFPEQVKCRLQIQKSSHKLTPVSCAVGIVREGGLPAVFRGLPSLLMRDVPFNFLFFGSYELFCYTICHGLSLDRNRMSPFYSIIAGGSAGAVAWSCVYPFDVVKSRVQTGQGTMPETMMWARSVGIRRLYMGAGAAIVRAFPANGALFAGYEMSYRILGNFSE